MQRSIDDLRASGIMNRIVKVGNRLRTSRCHCRRPSVVLKELVARGPSR